MNTAAELADQLAQLAASDVAGLDPNERAALVDAAARLRQGQGPMQVLARLLGPALARLQRP